MTGVTLITPTGGRQEALVLCELWISRQTYPYDIQWLCSDDCLPRSQFTGFAFQEIINPEWIWKPGGNTQAQNLSLLLGRVKYDKILFIEDDEWYSPRYIEEMVLRLDAYPMVGQGYAHYYNVRNRTWFIHTNRQHACLARTGIKSKLIPLLLPLFKPNTQFIDIEIWKRFDKLKSGVFTAPVLSVGIKGMPGRPGIGIGHKNVSTMLPDPDLRVLREWIGDDAHVYERYAA